MNLEDFYNAVKKPGIYYFHNTINDKYYIGQAQEIRNRVIKHKLNFESGRYQDAHIYRAFQKYGIEAFEFGVLEIVDLPKGEERNKKLDELEIKYIKKYNSYGRTGYNQTTGGDGGIDGYKFTEQQKYRQRINSLERALDGRYKLYFYDTKNKQYGEVPSFKVFLESLDRDTIENRFVEKQICYFGRYILSHTKSNLEKKIKVFCSSDYHYCLSDFIDDKTNNLQEEINNKVDEYTREIEDFYEKYGRAKYNRKDNKAKKDEIRSFQKIDLENGITKNDYKKKYGIKSDNTFYEHVKKLYPDWLTKIDRVNSKNKENTSRGNIVISKMTDEMRQDIINGMCRSKFLSKYNVSEASFYRYKFKIEEELNIKITSKNYNKNDFYVSEEQETDIINGISTIDYVKKYNVVDDTFYYHRRLVIERHPELNREREHKYKPQVNIELIKDDILNGISVRDFCLKYNLSKSSYKKYKRIIFGNNLSISSNITEEMQYDLKNGISVSDYVKKYKVSKCTYYEHKKRVVPSDQIEKRHITLDDLITENMKNDLLSGISGRDYMIKYNCTLKTYYAHRKHIIPDDSERKKNRLNYDKNYKRGITEEQKKDLKNGMSERDFILKYNVSHRTYENYKKKLLLNEVEIIELF